MSSVRLEDCSKLQNRKATAEGKPEDEAYDREFKNNDFIHSSEYIVVKKVQQKL